MESTELRAERREQRAGESEWERVERVPDSTVQCTVHSTQYHTEWEREWESDGAPQCPRHNCHCPCSYRASSREFMDSEQFCIETLIRFTRTQTWNVRVPLIH